MGLFGKKKEAGKSCCEANCTPEQMAQAQITPAVDSVKVLGAGCKSCHEQYENVKAAVSAMGLSIEPEYITDMEKVMSYGVMHMPAIVVNEKVVAMGKVYSVQDVMELLKKAGGN